jgi:hypothetical protein
MLIDSHQSPPSKVECCGRAVVVSLVNPVTRGPEGRRKVEKLIKAVEWHSGGVLTDFKNKTTQKPQKRHCVYSL